MVINETRYRVTFCDRIGAGISMMTHTERDREWAQEVGWFIAPTPVSAIPTGIETPPVSEYLLDVRHLSISADLAGKYGTRFAWIPLLGKSATPTAYLHLHNTYAPGRVNAALFRIRTRFPGPYDRAEHAQYEL